MQDKLKLLLEQINIPDQYRIYFNDGTLDKICVVKSDNKVKFLITLTQILPVSAYVKFVNLLNEYYEYFMNEYTTSSPLLEMFIGIPIEISNDNLTIEVSNKAEVMKFNSIKDRLIEDLKNIGFIINIEVKENVEASNAIINKIEEEKRKQAELLLAKENEKNKIVKGREVTTDPRPLSEVNYEGDNITIEAKIFGIDAKETPKINILTLKVTDNTDSIFCKVFERDNEKYKQLISNLKEGNWYKIKGRVQDDAYSKELVMMANDIMKVEHAETKIKDEEEEKRVELHAHTMMSQMDGVADEIALVKQAMAFGHRGIAITDHNGCQAFPHVFNTVTEYNKKIENEEDKFKA